MGLGVMLGELSCDSVSWCESRRSDAPSSEADPALNMSQGQRRWNRSPLSIEWQSRLCIASFQMVLAHRLAAATVRRSTCNTRSSSVVVSVVSGWALPAATRVAPFSAGVPHKAHIPTLCARRRAGWLARERDPYFVSKRRPEDERPLRPSLCFLAPPSGAADAFAWGTSAGVPGDEQDEWPASPLPYDLAPLVKELS